MPATSIRTRYPVTATDMRLTHGNRGDIITRHCPPAYQSRTGKVKRWPAETLLFADRLRHGIRGLTAATLRIVPVTPRTDLRRLRAFGTWTQMEEIIATARRIWDTLPGGREIETLFDRMFPAEIVLTPETIITDPAALKRMRKKAAPSPQETPAAPLPPSDHPELIPPL